MKLLKSATVNVKKWMQCCLLVVVPLQEAHAQDFDAAIYCQKPELSISVSECEAVIDLFNSIGMRNAKYILDDGREIFLRPFWEEQPDVGRWPGISSYQGKVKSLFFQHYKVKGEIPASVLNLVHLESINFRGRGLKGELPYDWFTVAPNLGSVFIYNTRISGLIPDVPLESDRFGGRSFRIENNNFSGPIPPGIFNDANFIHLANNNLSGRIPDTFSDFRGNTLDLSNNKLTGEVPKINLPLDYAFAGTEFRLANNQLTGSVHFIAHLASVWHVDISNNKFTGSIPNLSSWRTISDFNVSNNNLSGELPEFTMRQDSIFTHTDFNFSGNEFVGGIPDSYISLIGETLDLRNNKLSVGLARFKQRYEAKNRRNKILLSGQTPYELVSNNNAGRVLSVSRELDGHSVYKATIPQGYTIGSVSGCSHSLAGNMITIPNNTYACELKVDYRRCTTVEDCTLDAGTTAGVQNAFVESPEASATLSGVVQFRGWLHEPLIRSLVYYDVDRPRTATLFVDDGKLPLEVSFERADVATALGYPDSKAPALGWSALFNIGNLSNGEHQLVLKNEEGATIAHRRFHSFSMKNEQGDFAFFPGNDKKVIVDDFPFANTSVELAFNSSEQNFSITDQFNSQGNSYRSSIVHYTDDDLKPLDTALINNVPQVAIETPSSGNPMLGVMSIRGWSYGSDLHQGPIFLTLDDGQPFRVSRGHREDVENSMDIRTNSKLGWSQLFYAGNLENGMHRLRVFGRNTQGDYILLSQTTFESFVPVNQDGDAFYLSGLSKELKVEDFPFDGSAVTVRFNVAGQNFVVVEQTTP